MPAEPPNLTAGIPTPEQIAAQKLQFAAALDKQLADAIETVKKETQIEKEMVAFNAQKQIALYNMQVDEKLCEMQALAEEQAAIGACELNKAKVERTLQLNTQAQNLTFDYHLKATQQELADKRDAFDRALMAEENALAKQFEGAQKNAGGVSIGQPSYGAVGATAATTIAAYAAPAAASYVAAPAATYAAPATTAYAAPAATYAAPATTAYAAPTMQSMAYTAPLTTSVPSYTATPSTYSMIATAPAVTTGVTPAVAPAPKPAPAPATKPP